LERFPESLARFPEEIGLQVEYDIKYEGYVARQQVQVERQERMMDKKIPSDFDYLAIVSLRNEAKQKFSRIRPLNLDQASRISGITPADISLVLAYLENPKLRNPKTPAAAQSDGEPE
jgi:tRNA uridine 5-carboxymethylaminomethyl modification enzyme